MARVSSPADRFAQQRLNERQLIRVDLLRGDRSDAARELSVDPASSRGKWHGVGAGAYAAGAHRVSWNGRDATGREAPDGMYFVRLQTPVATRVTKAVLARRAPTH